MKLRDALIPNVTQDRIDLIRSKILKIESMIAHEDVGKLLEAFAKETGRKDFDLEYFRHFHLFESLDEFVLKAAAPEAKKVEGLTKEELTWIVERVMEGNEHNEYYLDLLQKNVPDPEVTDLIYWPSHRGFERELSAREIVEHALKYKATDL